jgi:hypothetical protein
MNSSIVHDLTKVRRRKFALLVSVVLFAACVIRYWAPFDPRAFLHRGYGEPTSLAHSLNDTGTFANPFAVLDTGPSAIMSPVFPTFFALILRVFGDGSLGANAFRWSAVLFLALQLALFPKFSKILGMGDLNGVVASSIWIIAKPQLAEGFESLDVALLVAVVVCCYRLYLAAQPQMRQKITWLLGGLTGFMIFTLPTMVSVCAVWLAWEMWRQKSAFWKKSFVPLILLPILIISPWTIRNYLVFHHFVLIRDNSGLELSVSNNDCAQFAHWAIVASGCFDQLHPNHNLNEAWKVLELGEVKYNDLRLREASHWIVSHPSRFAKLTAMRFVAFWMPTETFSIHYAGNGRRFERVVIYLMTLLSAIGLVILYRRDFTSAALLFSCLIAFPLIYYIVQFQDRYRYPIMWVTFLLGAMPVTVCAQRIWRNFNRATPAI